MKKIISNILTKFQKDAIYENHSTKEVYMNNRFSNGESYQSSGYKFIEFNDQDNQKHRFLYKAPSNGTNKYSMVFGGTDFDLNDTRYKNFLDEVASFGKNDQNIGVIVPIYPGYHENKFKPNEKAIMNSADKILEYLVDKNTRASQNKLGDNEIKSKDITMIGYSLGGAIAATITAKNKEIENLILISPPSSVKDASVDVLSENRSMFIKKIINKIAALFNEKYDTIAALKNLKNPNTKITHIVSANEDFNKIKGLDNKTHTKRLEDTLSASKNYRLNIVQDHQENSDPHTNIINNNMAMYNLKIAITATFESKNSSNKNYEKQIQKNIVPTPTPKIKIGSHRNNRNLNM